MVALCNFSLHGLKRTGLKLKKLRLLLPAATILFSISSQAALVSISTPNQNGVTITTILDTDNSLLTYEFDLTSLPMDYNNISFYPSPLPIAAIPLGTSNSVSSLDSTEFNFSQQFDNTGTRIGWRLELLYEYNTPPPRKNSIVISYDPSAVQLTGGFTGQSGDDNFQVAYRKPVGGFPAGKNDNITFWAYVPEIQTAVVPVLPAFWLFGSGLSGLIIVAIRKREKRSR